MIELDWPPVLGGDSLILLARYMAVEHSDLWVLLRPQLPPFMGGWTVLGCFFLYLPIIIQFIALLIAGGVLQLLLMPFVLLIRKLRRRPPPNLDASRLLINPWGNRIGKWMRLWW
ncbi:hypothetical protein [Arthrobacter sp. OV608]|uniref:hypothetical protein n=1 Tax=Arthrobacter sp. OV608 TaxID=1882768 RepID=UPI0008BF9CF2|nr:hypothetical protein [Arthrobacter sp. OV608]SER35038.1 hypothetical protein SAMN05444745_1433 [Arthrobacter sp. OV608]